MSSYKQSYTEEQIDRLIAERFSVALMNDSKWERLLGRLTTTFEGGVHIAYKLIHSDKIRQTTLTSPDFKPFFTEPTLYREIEWLEFTSRYEARYEGMERLGGGVWSARTNHAFAMGSFFQKIRSRLGFPALSQTESV